MSLADVLAEDRRLTILLTLCEAPAGSANESVLRLALERVGHRAAHDLVRADLTFLTDHGLASLEKMPNGRGGELWIATLTTRGEDVANGRQHPGVARKGAD
jgi:hypothetical protein